MSLTTFFFCWGRMVGSRSTRVYKRRGEEAKNSEVCWDLKTFSSTATKGAGTIIHKKTNEHSVSHETPLTRWGGMLCCEQGEAPWVFALQTHKFLLETSWTDACVKLTVQNTCWRDKNPMRWRSPSQGRAPITRLQIFWRGTPQCLPTELFCSVRRNYSPAKLQQQAGAPSHQSELISAPPGKGNINFLTITAALRAAKQETDILSSRESLHKSKCDYATFCMLDFSTRWWSTEMYNLFCIGNWNKLS